MIPFARILVTSIVICVLLAFAMGYFSAVKLQLWSDADASALLLLGMANGTLSLGLFANLYESRVKQILWLVYLCVSPVTIVWVVQ